MDFLSGVCSTLVTEGLKQACVAVVNTRNVEKLKEKNKELETKRDDLQSQVYQAGQNGHKISEDVPNYISNANRLSLEANTFIKDEWERAVIKCFCLSIPNLVSRRRLSIRAKEMAGELERTINDAAGDRFLTITSRPALQSRIANRDGYEDFDSRKKILEEVMAALSCDEVSVVGVYGMGGVGKTMLAHEVARQTTKNNLFSEVAFITVSQTQDLINIQKVVADKIGLNFEGITDVYERADRLKRRLKEEKRFLVILDDIWDGLDLIKVGLNFENDQKGCKILMTSRNVDVTRDSMGAKKNIMVEHLSDIEASNLFNTIVGTNVVEQLGIKKLVDDVVKECKGLPLVIRVVASALKDKKSPGIWEDALRQLQNAAPTNIDRMLTEVYPSIKLSFDSLKSIEEAQKLLLLCSLYGEDVNIQVEEIMMLSIGLDILKGVHNVEAARTRVESLVDILKDRCLLLNGYDCGCVKMHDVIRDVAIHISENSWGMHRFMINDSLEDCLSDKKLEGAKALSLLRNQDYIELPKIKLECPQLELFLIIHYYSDQHTPNIMDFLNECADLKVLCLHRVYLSLMPSSLDFLHNLKILRLYDCKLNDIDFIGDLQNLRVLDLSRSTIQQLPSKIGKLTRLQVLNLKECQQLEAISENVISSLTKLEELYFPRNFNYWKAGEVSTDKRNSNLAELMNLQKLTTLFLSIPGAEILPKGFLFSQNLKRYTIGIGSNYYYQREVTKSLFLRDCEESRLKEHGIEALMRRSESLNLSGFVGGVKNNVVYDPDKEGFPELKKLTLSDCSEVQYVVNMLESPIFLKLESLHLQRLENLEEICHGMPTPDSFKQLRKVTVEKCGKLKNLFPLSIATRLHEIEVRECEMMEEIFGHDQREEEVVFNELRVLILWSLPKLVQFMISQPQMGVTNVSSSTDTFNYPLFGGKTIVFPSLENVYLHRLNITRLWEDRLLLVNLKDLRLSECKNMTYALSSSTVRTTLFQLESIWIGSCEDLEEVVAITEEPAETKANVSLSFPKLQYLSLRNLPKLKQFCKGDGVVFPLLSRLSIHDCREMRVFNTDHHEEMKLVDYKQPFFSHKTIVFPLLERVYLFGLNIITLWEDQLSLANLKYLEVRQCKNLKYVLSSSNVRTTLFQLEGLWIDSCEDLEEVVAIIEEPAETKANVSLSFPKLQILSLKNLPKLKQFCKGDSVEFPLLSELTIFEMKVFIAYHLEEMKLVDYKQTLFSLKVAFPNRLCTIRTDWNEVINDLFGQSQFPCCNLKEIDVNYTAQDEPISLSIFEMLHRYQNLEILKLKGCFVNAQTSSSNVLQSLSQPLMSFHNLTILKVLECNDLTYLLDSSTARGLSQLKEMWIWKCTQMKDIIIRDSKECETKEDDAFDFKRLEGLVLYDLPNLKSFFSGNNAIMFLRLENLFLIKCPEMKSFSNGIITTFILSTIITEIRREYETWMYIDYMKRNAKRQCWNGDVNTTIRKIWEESSNSLIQQSLTNTDVEECSGEASSTKDN